MGSFLKKRLDAGSAPLRVLKRNVRQEDAFIRKPKGGCSIPPLLSQYPK